MRRILLAVLVMAAPAALGAQVVPAGARAAGLGDNYGVLARGFGAGYWNPANLGQRGNPAFSLELPGVGVSASADPIKLSDIKKYGGDTLPNSVKQQWLNSIGPNGALELRTQADVSEAGLSIGPVAITAGTTAGIRGDLPHDAVATMLYGNAGPSGQGDTLSFTNGALQAFAVSHIGLSLGIPIPVHITHAADERFSVGITAKYVMGHGLLDARDGKGQLTPDSASVRFVTVALYDPHNAINGTGMGFDIGAAWTSGKLAAGLTIYDVANSFRFKDQGKVGSLNAFVSPDSSGGTSNQAPIDSATDSLKQAAQALASNERFLPSMRLAVGYRLTSRIQLSGDILHESTDPHALVTQKGTTVGVGAELRFIPLIPLRAGVRFGDGATSFSVGTGLALGPLHIDGAVGRRTSTGYNAAVGITFGAW
ncbi:MAG TPA: DUF5723 family protein [Gemmatimonadales bacterium]|nr:DUF5723 family protein [Gemmatimonadales bacterium]